MFMCACSINRKEILPGHPGQKGCPSLIPGLRSMPVWYHPSSVAKLLGDNDEKSEVKQLFPWIDALEAAYEDIRSEFLSMQGKQTDAEKGIKFQVFEWTSVF